MKKNYSFKSKLALSLIGLGLANIINAQCINTTQFPGGTVAIPDNLNTQVSTCIFASDFSVISVTTAGNYTITGTGGAGNYFTVTDALNVPIVSGISPLTVAIPSSGIYRIHTTINAACALESVCHTVFVAGPLFTPPPPITNDDCATAITISSSATTPGTTVGSLVESPAPPVCSSTGLSQPGIWYRVVGNGNRFGATTCGTAWDNKIFVYSGSCGALTSVGCNDDNGPLCSGSSASVAWCSLPSVDYYILVTGFSSANAFNLITTETVVVNPNVVVNPTSISLCTGKSATITASGATTYAWSTGSTSTSITVTPLVNTTYTVTGSGLACSIPNIKTVVVTVNANPTVTIAGASSFCSSSPSALTASGAASYAWSTGAGSNAITPTATGSYSVIGTSAFGCTATATKAFTLNPSPSLTLTVTGATFGCPTSTLTNFMTASGANTYSWSTGATTATINPTSTVSTVYSVVGTALNGCTDTKSSSINISNPLLVVTSSHNPLCIGEPFATLTAGGASTYTWSTASTNTVINVTPSTTTSYTLAGTTNTCSAFIVFTQSVSACTGVEETENSTLGVSVYPNPNNGEFTIELNNGLTKTIEIADITGRIVLANKTSNDKIKFNISNLSQGVYYVKVISNDRFEVIKIVKQ